MPALALADTTIESLSNSLNTVAIMNSKAAQTYLRTKVLTATPEQLQLMLYDGAIRFSEQAKLAIEQKNFQQSYTLINKTQNIVTQMVGSLRHDIYPELCGKLASLYTFALRRLIQASRTRKVEPLQEAIDVLQSRMEASICMQG
jgi:flagellar protein FliS